MEQNLFGNKKVLITGASGLVGAHLLIKLLQQGVSVRALVRNQTSKNQIKYMALLYPEVSINLDTVDWFYGDITNYNDVLESTQGIQYIFNCAGYVSFNNKDSKQLELVNVVGTANIVNAALENSCIKLCHVSSIAAIGKSINNEPITEVCEYEYTKQGSPYSNSKYLGELEVWRGIAEGLQAVIVNPSVIIGAGNWSTSSTTLFTNVAKGMKYYTSGITGYVSVHDVVTSMILLMQSNIVQERFIISSQNLDYKTIFSAIAQSINKPVPTKLAKPWLIQTAAIMLKIISFFTGKSPQITMHTAKTASNISLYSNKKICEAIQLEFSEILPEITNVGKVYLASKGN